MLFYASGNRCMFDPSDARLPLCAVAAYAVLDSLAFSIERVDIVALARTRIAISRYRRGAKPADAPAEVDCSSFVKWLFASCGIMLPRRAVQQREVGAPVPMDGLAAGDLVFATGWRNLYQHDPDDGVGHVGVYTGNDTVIHAARARTGVVETNISAFVNGGRWRGARRILPASPDAATVICPDDCCVETSDDLRWIILQRLPR